MLKQEQIAQFNHDGYLIIKNFWPDELLKFWESTLILFYLRQASKVGGIKNNLVDLIRKNNLQSTDLDKILHSLEDKHKEVGYQVLKMLEGSQAAHQMMSTDKLVDVSYALMNCPRSLLTIPCICPFINLPSSKRLLYRWHSESCYYPKRRNFLNMWFPIFRNKNTGNGTMWVCKKSHEVPERHFVEYQGYDQETENKKNHFIQYEIPESELSEYEKVPIVAERGDVVFFHRALAHASTINQSTLPSYASVMRIFDYGSDLTLSGDPAVQPFKDLGGIAELIPIQSSIFHDTIIE